MGGDTPAGWTRGRLRDLLVRDEDYVATLPHGRLLRLSVKLYGNGVVAGVESEGESVRLPRHQFAKANQVVVSEIWAKKGAIGVVPADLAGSLVSSHFYLFNLRDSSDRRWIDMMCRAERFSGWVSSVSQGTTGYAAIRARDFLLLPLAYPPAPERQALGQVLSWVETIQHNQAQIIANLQLAKRAIMARLLVGDDAGGARPMKPSGVRWVFGRVAEGVERIPADWELVRLTSVAKLESGHTPSRKHPEYWNGPHPWLSLADSAELRNLVVRETQETITDDGLANSSARLLPAGTVVLSRTAVLGQTAMLGVTMATSQDFVGFICGERVEPRYLVQLFRQMGREWERLKAGSSPTNKTLYYSIFQALQILLPPLEEQRRIADVGEAFDQRIAAERAHLDALGVLKRGLADALLSGRVRLPAHLIASLAGEDAHVGP